MPESQGRARIPREHATNSLSVSVQPSKRVNISALHEPSAPTVTTLPSGHSVRVRSPIARSDSYGADIENFVVGKLRSQQGAVAGGPLCSMPFS